jgi:1-acyl-sn-glycerol-3-phosphate acyltransferase
MQVPIVPITFLDNWCIFPDSKGQKLLLRPGISRIVIHPPISTIGLTEEDANGLRDQVKDLIFGTLQKEGRCPFSKKC